MNTDHLRDRIRSFLGLSEPSGGGALGVHQEFRGDGYSRRLVSYPSDQESVEAFLFEPTAHRRNAAVVALHQHNSQWHIGKSEIAGLLGDPLQAFGPTLARAGVTVLAPDAVGFESRRGSALKQEMAALAPTLDPARGGTHDDWLQYYNQAMHRLVRGDLLIRKILVDAATAVTVLSLAAGTRRVGILGHSFGGNIALFAAALDTRIAFAASSGAACSYRYKLAKAVGLEMALVIPGFAARFDIDDLIRCVAPRPLFVVSAEDDPYSADADDVVARARGTSPRTDGADFLQHLRTPGGHALDQRRFDAIVEWVIGRC